MKVKQDMEIEIPKEDILVLKSGNVKVISNRNVATFIKEFVVKLPIGETLDFQSGGYIQIDVPACEVNFKDIIVEEAGDAYQVNLTVRMRAPVNGDLEQLYVDLPAASGACGRPTWTSAATSSPAPAPSCSSTGPATACSPAR